MPLHQRGYYLHITTAMESRSPNIPLPEAAGDTPCICGSGDTYGGCCRPKIEKLNRAVGGVERWRNTESHSEVFQAYSDLLWEEQYRDDEQGGMAQEYEEWDEWASNLWLDGVLFDGFTLSGTSSISSLIEERMRTGERLPGGEQTVRSLLESFEGLFQIASPLPDEEFGLVHLKLPPFETTFHQVPRVFLPPDTEQTDLVIGRFIPFGEISYPTHRPLVIPLLSDVSNLDAAYSVLAPFFPVALEGPGTVEQMIRLLKARGDLVLRAAIEGLLPLEEDALAVGMNPFAVDGGEIRYMVSDSKAVEHNLDMSPFFEIINPVTASEKIDRMDELLDDESLSLPRSGPGWSLQFLPEARMRLRPSEKQRVEDLLWSLVHRIRSPHGTDHFEQWATDPGLMVFLDMESGILSARALLAQPLELGRLILEREFGSFLARESEEYLTP